MKRTISLVVVLIMLVSVCSSLAAEKPFPNRPILMIVPFNPGGATDLIGRKLEPFMEEYLGVPIAVQNMPGGGTAIGNQYVMDAPHDGYTILVEPTDITSIAVMGQSKLTWRNWHMIGIAAAVPNVWVVHPDSPLKDVKDLEAAVKSGKPMSASGADSGCAWTRGLALFCDLVDGTLPQMVPMGGGYPAAVSALKKEVDLGSCGVPEAIDLISGNKVRALTYWGKEDLDVPGYGTIPAITNYYPHFAKYAPFGGWVGMAVAKDTPKDVIAKIQEAYDYAVAQPEFKEWVKDSFFLEVGLTGAAAEEYVSTSTSVNAWLMYDLGIAPVDPATFDIPRP